MRTLATPLSLLLSLCACVSMAAPPPGHPSVNDAERILQLPQETPPLPHRGLIEEAFDSNNYTYIRVRMGDQRRWLAAPRKALRPGQWIRFGEGRRLRNFFSRKHRRLFPEIWFVGPVHIESERI